MILYRNFIRADRKIKLTLNGITDIAPCDYIKINVFRSYKLIKSYQ